MKDNELPPIEEFKVELQGLEIRTQAQFVAVESKIAMLHEAVESKVAKLHGDVIAKLDFLVERAHNDQFGALEAQVGDHEQRLTRLEQNKA